MCINYDLKIFNVHLICATTNGHGTCGEVSFSSGERFSMCALNEMQTRTYTTDCLTPRFTLHVRAHKNIGPPILMLTWIRGKSLKPPTDLRGP